MLLKRPRYTFALNIARSDIFTQHSTFNSCTCRCFAVAKSLRKSSVEIKLPYSSLSLLTMQRILAAVSDTASPVSPKCRCSQRLAGMQSICGLEIQFSTRLGIQTPHYETFWLMILKNKWPKTEKCLNMPSRRFFDSPIQITFTAYVTADMQ